jgi:hypothetical protein
MTEQWEREHFRAKAYGLKIEIENVLSELDAASESRLDERLERLLCHALSAIETFNSYASFLRRQRGRKAADADLFATLESIAKIGGNVDVRA